jgi:hypothetical protein
MLDSFVGPIVWKVEIPVGGSFWFLAVVGSSICCFFVGSVVGYKAVVRSFVLCRLAPWVTLLLLV